MARNKSLSERGTRIVPTLIGCYAIGNAPLTSMTRAHDDLDDPVLFVAKFLVHFRRLFKAGGMCHDEAGVDLALNDLFQERLSISLNMVNCTPLSVLEQLREASKGLWGASSQAYFRVNELHRQLANPNLRDIPRNLPFRVEMWTSQISIFGG
jgi:hypothetical protein